jgi:integrase
MRGPTVKLVLRKQKAKADGTVPVWLRATHARRSCFASTGIAVTPKEWNAKRSKVRTSHPIADALNARLSDFLLRARHAALTARSADAVIASLNGGTGTLTAYFRRFLDALDDRGQYWEWRKYKTTLTKLHEALGDPVAWGALDQNGLARFERHLRTKRKNGANTTRKEFVRLRTVVRRAVKEGVLKPDADPFLTFAMPKREPVERRRLSRAEIDKVREVELPWGTRDRIVRDLYMLCFYAAGVRISDAVRLTPEHVRSGRLEYRMLKTGSLQSIKLPDQALGLLRPYLDAREERAREGKPYPYLFPLIKRGDDSDPIALRRRIQSATVRANKALKRVASAAGIEREGFTMHTARHSFADLARQSGDLYAVSKALGHTKLSTTQAYLDSFDRAAVDALTDSLWINTGSRRDKDDV